MNSNLHAHVSTNSRDCDGPTYDSHVVLLNDEEKAEHIKADGVNDFHDLHFKERVLGDIVSFHAQATVRVTPLGFTYDEPTEEGFTYSEVTWCEDASCNRPATSHRDVYAEQMGY